MNIKKLSFLVAVLFISMAGMAQKANIQSAINYLKDNEVDKAKKMIDEAVVNESTKTSAKAWMLRGVIYQSIATPSEFMPKMQFILNDNAYMIDLAAANTLKGATPNAMKEAIESYKKALSLDAKYNKDEILPLLSGLVILGFNDGISQMNASKFPDAIKSFEDVLEVSNVDNGKPFKGNPGFDTIFANTRLYQANSYYQSGKEEEALPMLEEAMKNPVTQNPDVYVMVTDIYERKNNEAKWLEVMKMAKAKYPADKRILNNEINYYLKSGKGEESIAKLKEGIAAEPNKVDLYVILGQTYYNMANPSDKDGNPLPRAANATELEQNALTNYAKAIELDKGNNAYAQFYTAILHYNNAKLMTDAMNKEKDDNKYQAMLPKRNEKIELAIPFFLKAKSLIEAEKVNESNKKMYKDILSGLAQSYMITDKADKSTEMQNLLKTVK
jgi:tetratricopeptide (TPR) repeat protein